MARYVNLDEALNILKNSLNYSENELGNANVEYKKGCIAAIKDDISNISHMPIADVVPRSEVEQAKQEVAREIFEEIEHEAYKNEEGDLYLDLPDYLKIKNKYKGE